MARATKKVLKDQANNIHSFPSQQSKNRLQLHPIKPITKNQDRAFKAYDAGKNLLLTGASGSGKTYIGLYLALKEVMLETSPYKKVVIVRSAVPTRDIGALPGDIDEKTNVYELPYYSMCTDFFEKEDAYTLLKDSKVVSFITTSFVRGITLSNCIVLVDETQNMTEVELFSVVTRAGENCKLIMCGDSVQTDYLKGQSSGFHRMNKVFHSMSSFESIKFEVDDVVRSKFLKEFYTIYDNLYGTDD